MEENRAWFVNTVTMFKPASGKSKDALDSDVVKIKEHHRLVIKPDLKEKALRISSYLVGYTYLPPFQYFYLSTGCE